MSAISQIIDGTVKNILNQNEELYNKRITICKTCPLIKTDSVFGEICNPTLYMNKSGEISKVQKPGFTHGCGCVLRSKCRVNEARCPLDR